MTTGFQPTSRLPVSGPDAATRRASASAGRSPCSARSRWWSASTALLVLVVGDPLPTTAALGGSRLSRPRSRSRSCTRWSPWWCGRCRRSFVACLLVELRGARRGSGLPGDVPLGGGSQAVARRLVASALLLAGAAALAPTGGAATAVPERPATIASVVDQQAAAAATQGTPGPGRSRPRPVPQAGAAAERARVTKTYQGVQPPEGRRYDCLWDIAERTLGDPLRYKEIFELNRDRVQPDGRRLVDADLIRPGWVLTMPADATGPGVVRPGARAARPRPRSPRGRGSRRGPGRGCGRHARPRRELGAPRTLTGAGLLAAGLLVVAVGRRGPYGSAPEAPALDVLRLAARPERAGLLDRALRTLADACATAGRPLPEVALAYVDEQHVTLSLVGAAGEPPAPGRSARRGRAGRCWPPTCRRWRPTPPRPTRRWRGSRSPAAPTSWWTWRPLPAWSRWRETARRARERSAWPSSWPPTCGPTGCASTWSASATT